MRKKSNIMKKLFGILLSVIMILGTVSTAFAAEESATITINRGTGITTSLAGMQVDAYLVLDQTNPLEEQVNKKQYAVTDAFKNFFNINSEETLNNLNETVFTGAENAKVYVSYDATQNHLTYSITSSEGAIEVSGAKLDVTYPQADIVSRLTAGDVNTTAAIFYTWVEKYIEASTITATKTVTANAEGQVVVDGLDEGYYALTFAKVPDGISVKQGIMIATAGDTMSIQLKAEEIPLTKQVKPADKTDYAATATAEMGEALEYQITSKVPTLADNDNLTKFEFVDTLENQKVTENSFSLQIGNISATKDTTNGIKFKIADKDVATLTVEAYDDTLHTQNFTLSFKTDVLADYEGQAITLTYQAALTADAVNINENNVILRYTNGPDQNKEIGPAHTEVYTYGIDVQKTFSDGSTTANYNTVTFQLYRADTVGNKAESAIFLVGNNGDYNIPGSGESGATSDLKLNSATGELKITGLDEGTYWLVETATNKEDGFTLAEDIKIVLVKSATTASELDKAASTAQYNGSGNDLLETVVAEDMTSISLGQFTVLNQKGFTLPQTGGAGTWMLTLGGIALIAVAGGLLVVSRKKSEK